MPPSGSWSLRPSAPLAAGVLRRVPRPGDVLPHWSLVGLLPAFSLLGSGLGDARGCDGPAAARDPPRRADRLRGPVRRPDPMGRLPERRGARHDRAPGPGEGSDRGPDGLGRAGGGASPSGPPALARRVPLRRRVVQPAGTSLLLLAKWRLGRVPVLCYNPRGNHNFAYWEDSRRWDGHDGLLVVIGDASTEPGMFDSWFERIEPAGEFSVLRAGSAVRRVRLFRCVRQASAQFPGAGDRGADRPRARPGPAPRSG